MRRAHLSRLMAFVLAAAAVAVAAADLQNPLRGGAAIPVDAPPPPLATPQDDDRRRTRNYPEQPPVIPHKIDGYEISLRANRCLACHSRRLAAQTGAPMVSVSHFMGRDLQVLSEVSPRRYACLQCHVPQTAAPLPVQNNFIDAADLPRE